MLALRTPPALRIFTGMPLVELAGTLTVCPGPKTKSGINTTGGGRRRLDHEYILEVSSCGSIPVTIQQIPGRSLDLA